MADPAKPRAKQEQCKHVENEAVHSAAQRRSAGIFCAIPFAFIFSMQQPSSDVSLPGEPNGNAGGEFPRLIKSSASFVFEVIKTVLISVAIIVLIRYFLFKPFYVRGASMEPTFENNEYLIINEIDYRFHPPQRGDVVVFRFPRDPSQYFIKRVVGLPGETVTVRGGVVVIHNEKYPEGFTLDESLYLSDDVKTFGDATVTLDQNHYYVLGDNRAASLDSRSEIVGPIPRADIIGRTWFRIWPPRRMSLFHTPEYPQQ